MDDQLILEQGELDFQWQTTNPFLFCAYHRDNYPAGNEQAGPAPSALKGRNIGNDFRLRDGWRMYHGETVPGFPVHPHRGFETVTIVLKGLIDHSDSHGAAGRYGDGDVQWMTAGSGLQHAEMFPLVQQDRENPLELFQVWLNLPHRDKFVAPHFKMLWSESIPVVTTQTADGAQSRVRLIAGSYQGLRALAPAPDSWAASELNHVRIMLVDMDPASSIQLDAVSPTLSRMAYYYSGSSLTIGGQEIKSGHFARLAGDRPAELTNGPAAGRLLILEGEPIQEKVVQYGPFVMSSEQEINEAFRDYRQTEFGGWPWDRPDPVHFGKKRFARYQDGTVEEP